MLDLPVVGIEPETSCDLTFSFDKNDRIARIVSEKLECVVSFL